MRVLLAIIVLLGVAPLSHSQIVPDSTEQQQMGRANGVVVRAYKQQPQEAQVLTATEYTTRMFGINDDKRARGEDVEEALLIKIIATDMSAAVSCVSGVVGREIAVPRRTGSYFWWMLNLEDYLAVTRCSGVEHAIYDPSNVQLDGS